MMTRAGGRRPGFAKARFAAKYRIFETLILLRQGFGATRKLKH
jgi:hypothetical protein